MEKKVDQAKIIASLMKIGHGDLDLYTKEVLPFAKVDPLLFGKIIVWNIENGKVKDSKRAFPILALRGLTKQDYELAENALASLCSLDPRELYKAYLFSKELTKQGLNIPANYRKLFQWSIQQYLKIRESDRNWWNRTVLSHRKAMLGLYTVSHLKPKVFAQNILFKKVYPKDSVFEVVKNLKLMEPREAAGNILKYKIPMQIAIGAVRSIKDNDIILALIEGMSGNELINNSRMLEKLKVFNIPELKAAYDSALERAKNDRRVNTLKVTRAAQNISDKKVVKKLEKVQEKQIDNLKDIEANCLILGDRSGSMKESIEVAKQIAGIIARKIKGETHLIFFDNIPEYYDVSGKTLAEIQTMTKHIFERGSTSIGCGLKYIFDKNLLVNLIVIVTDQRENCNPYFNEIYSKYIKAFNIEPTIYIYSFLSNDVYAYFGDAILNDSLKRNGIDFTEFDLSKGTVDYYSLPNLVNTMRVGKYFLLDEIMKLPLLTFEQIFKMKGK